MRFHCDIWFKPLSEIYSTRLRKGNKSCSSRKDKWGRLLIISVAEEEEKGAWICNSEETHRYFNYNK